MKVLHINPYPPAYLGGSEIFCKNLAINLLQKKNVQSDILTSDIQKHRLKSGFLIDNSIEIIYKKNFYNLWGKNPIVNIFNYLKNNYNNYDIIHAHSYIFFTSLQCALLHKLKKFNFVLHIHGGISTPPLLSSNLVDLLQLHFKNLVFDNTVGKFTIKNADSIVSVSNKDLMLIKQKFQLNHERTYYIPNGIDAERFKKTDQTERKYITFIGRLTYIKGIDIFINYIKELYKKDKNFKFLIVGSGPLINLVKEAKKELPIKYFPYYPYDQIEEIYNISKVLILSSRFEGIPTTLLESLACETPVIANNVGGVSEVLKHKKNGLLYRNILDHDAINKSIELIKNEQKLKETGKAGRKLIEEQFTWNLVTEQITNVYKELIEN